MFAAVPDTGQWFASSVKSWLQDRAGVDDIAGPVAEAYFGNRPGHQIAPISGSVGPVKNKKKYKNLISDEFSVGLSGRLWNRLDNYR